MSDAPAPLSPETRQQVIAIVKETLRRELGGEAPRGLAATLPELCRLELETPRALFVTLRRRDGELRGCIGTTRPELPLAEAVRDLAISAATQDRRFDPVGASELDQLVVEVSVLSPLSRADTSRIEIGRHGLVVRAHGRSGLLLPQVASERGWDADTFLRMTCRKAGLPDEAWRDEAASVLWFTCDVIEDEAVEA